MAKITFNKDQQIDDFTLILVRKDYSKIGIIHGSEVVFRDAFNEPDELSFKVQRPLDKRGQQYWDRINDYNALYVPEIGPHGEYFGMEVTLNEDVDGVYKTVTCTGLAEEELDNAKVYNLEINTEAERENDPDWGITYITLFCRDLTPYENNVNAKKATMDEAKSIIDSYGENPEETQEYQDAVTVYNTAKKDYQDAQTEYEKNRWFSMLHRILDKAPNYTLKHVDATLLNLTEWYQFSINDQGIYSVLTGDVAEQYHCYFKFDSYDRSISVYDLYSTCNNDDCAYRLMMKRDRGITTRYRADFHEKCPYCDSTNITPGYGIFTKIAVTKDNLLTAAQVSSNKDQLKNCFHLEAGDEMMTATVMNQNPNGSNYIYQFSEECKEEMPQDLVQKIEEYYTEYNKWYYGNEDEDKGVYTFSQDLVDKYNEVIDFLQDQGFEEEVLEEFTTLQDKYVGYDKLTALFYSLLDLQEYLQEGMLPTVATDKRSLQDMVSLMIPAKLSPVSVMNVQTENATIIENSIQKVITAIGNVAMYRFDVVTDTWVPGTVTYVTQNGERIKQITNGTWTGHITIRTIEYIDTEKEKENTATVHGLTLSVDENYVNYIKQTVDKAFATKDAKIKPVTDLTDFAKVQEDAEQFEEFKKRLHLYNYNYLSETLAPAYEDVCGQIAQAGDQIKNLYYPMYYRRLIAIQEDSGVEVKTVQTSSGPVEVTNSDMLTRVQELKDLYSQYIQEGDKGKAAITYLMQQGVEKDDGEIGIRKRQIDAVEEVLNLVRQYREDTRNHLNFEAYLGERLWHVFCNYRREDNYKNDNYISDDLTNAEMVQRAADFIQEAQKELYKASNLQYSVSGSLNNLLALREFQPIVNEFETGNWIHMFVDEKKYDLRMLSYQITFDEKQSIDVEFSTVEKEWTGATDVKSIIESAGSIAGSYSYLKQQVKNNKAISTKITRWFQDGIDATTTLVTNNADTQDVVIDGAGLWARAYDELSEAYSPYQLRIMSNGLYTTTDGWNTISTGVGQFAYRDPETGELSVEYGVIARTVVGQLIVGENLKIFNDSLGFKIDQNGLIVKNSDGTVTVDIDPNATNIFKITADGQNKFYVDNDGNININNSTITAGVLRSADYSYTSDNTYANQGMEIDLLNKTIRTPYFAVDSNGKLNATDGYFEGQIEATSGKIGVFTLSDDGWLWSPTLRLNAQGLDILASGTDWSSSNSTVITLYGRQGHFSFGSMEGTQKQFYIDANQGETEIYGGRQLEITTKNSSNVSNSMSLTTDELNIYADDTLLNGSLTLYGNILAHNTTARETRITVNNESAGYYNTIYMYANGNGNAGLYSSTAGGSMLILRRNGMTSDITAGGSWTFSSLTIGSKNIGDAIASLESRVAALEGN